MSQRRFWQVTESGLVVPRREFLKGGLATFAAAMMSKVLPGCDGTSAMDGGMDAGMPMNDAGMDAGYFEFPVRTIPDPPPLQSLIGSIGPLQAANADGMQLPLNFTGRVIATSGEVVPGTTYEWHSTPDGGATFLTEDGGWIYVSNSELPLAGGASALRFDSTGNIVDAYRILNRTNMNCSGGRTPWHTWISCEEATRGRVWECDPWGEVTAVERALGIFKHEALTLDRTNMHLYLSEDETDGRFYRFVPDRLNARGFPDLSSGRMEAAVVALDNSVTWVEIPDPQFTGATPLRMQAPSSTPFDGGEGIWWHNGVVYLSTKGDDHIWAYDVAAAQISVLYDGSGTILNGVDAVTVSCCGDVLVAEDGGSMDIVAILPSGELKQLVHLEGQDTSEITGIAFSPDGQHLYFGSQRGGASGLTYEVTGPFHAPA